MRRISTGIVGRELLGRFTAFDNSLRSIENNQDIVLNPNGSGIVRSDAHIQVNDENSVRFADSGSSNYVEIKAPSSLSSNITLTLPDSTTAGNVLTTDGSGNLTFSDLTIEVSNQTGDTDTYYPLLSTSDSGSISSVDVSNSKLSFQPSSGRLTVTDLSVTDLDASNINASGNVGIGTTSTPSEKLEVNGNIQINKVQDSSGNLMLSGVVNSGQVSLSNNVATISTGVSAANATFMLAIGIDDPDSDSEISGTLFWDDSEGEYYVRIREIETSVNPTVNYDVIRVR